MELEDFVKFVRNRKKAKRSSRRQTKIVESQPTKLPQDQHNPIIELKPEEFNEHRDFMMAEAKR